MTRFPPTLAVLVLLMVPSPGSAQTGAEPLSLPRAIAMALAGNPDVAAVTAGEAAAGAGLDAAQGAWFPRITLEEGWQRGNQPVYVFGSLLAQRRFTEADFAVRALNDPDALGNHRAAVHVEQVLFDGGRTRALARAAESAAGVSSANRTSAEAGTAEAVARTYAGILVADAAVRSADAAVATAESDAARARARRDTGLATEADALSFDVHLARMRSVRITAAEDAAVARATLNRLLGVPLETPWEFVTPSMPPPPAGGTDPGDVSGRPDVRRAGFGVDRAVADAGLARSALLPQVSLQGGYEWNGRAWTSRASSWVVGLQARLSLSLAGTERARMAAAQHTLARARAERDAAEADARLDIRQARARLDAARARLAVAAAVVAQSRESQRILRDRYEAGLATVTDVLRAADAVLAADTLETTSRTDVVVATVMFDRALGRIPRGE